MLVRHDRSGCIGCNACVAICPLFWEMNDDGKSTLIGGAKMEGNKGWFGLIVEKKDEDCNRTAADVCPVKAIYAP